MEMAKKMKVGHNIIGNGEIRNRLYPGGFKYGKKGKQSLNPAQKNKNDSEGQKSYKQEDT